MAGSGCEGIKLEISINDPSGIYISVALFDIHIDKNPNAMNRLQRKIHIYAWMVIALIFIIGFTLALVFKPEILQVF